LTGEQVRIYKEVVAAIFKDCLDVYLGRGAKNEAFGQDSQYPDGDSNGAPF
jgi:hypothetical protein